MTDQIETSFDMRRDGLGLVVFTTGAFFSVLLVLALLSAGPLEKAEGMAALARLWAGSIGLVPALVFCGGCAFLGARLFLAGKSDIQRHAGGLALVALGLSVLFGAFSASAGGLVGSLTAGALSRATHVAVGALLGLGVLGGALRVAWLRPARDGKRSAEPMDALDAEREKAAVSHASDLGVTAAEAAALIPADLPSWRAEPKTEPALTSIPDVANPATANPALSITTRRVDIRRRGEVPEGARPLFSPHVHIPATPTSSQPIDEPSASSVQHWTPASEPGMPADPVDEDLARAEEPETLPEPLPKLSSEIAEPEEEAEIEEVLSEIEAETEFEDEESDVELDEEASPIESEEPDEEASPVEKEGLESTDTEPVLRPSWEQPTLFQEGEEPVDAYGTPLSLVTPHADIAEEEPQAEAADSEEDEVVLLPVAAPAKKRAPATRSQEKERSRLLAEVGCLFVDRGRVAVSMLQKQFDMDFEEATEVLDELQALGLIGPYLGGQRRDILLTRDEWLEKVSSL